MKRKINLDMLKLNQMLITHYYMNLYDDSREMYIKDMIAIHFQTLKLYTVINLPQIKRRGSPF